MSAFAAALQSFGIQKGDFVDIFTENNGRWDDYLSALLYVNRADMRPVSLALQLFNDPSSGSDIGSTLAMSTLSIVPATIIFLIFQKSLVEGIASTGIKG